VRRARVAVAAEPERPPRAAVARPDDREVVRLAGERDELLWPDERAEPLLRVVPPDAAVLRELPDAARPDELRPEAADEVRPDAARPEELRPEAADERPPEAARPDELRAGAPDALRPEAARPEPPPDDERPPERLACEPPEPERPDDDDDDFGCGMTSSPDC
jgi:hypothetical protein